MRIKIGTRKSKLALAQTHIVINKLRNIDRTLNFEIKEILTTGDILYKEALDKVGGKGLFLKEIEEELLRGNIDIAVHSMKDVPVYLPKGLVIDCTLKREDPRDVLISKNYNSLKSLPINAIVGTSSLRRKLQLLEKRTDLRVLPLRGNVTTRIAKVANNELDACILAYAGVKRLGLEEHIKQVFETEEFLPAVAQGAIGVERREDDMIIASLLDKIHDLDTFLCIQAERSFMKEIEGNCTTPFAAYSIKDGNNMHLIVKYFDELKRSSYVVEVRGEALECVKLGQKAAMGIKKQLNDFELKSK